MLIGLADLIVRLLYDPRYAAAGGYLSILAIGTAFMMVTRSMESVQVATGRQRFAIEANILRLALLVTGGVAALALHKAIVLIVALGILEPCVYGFGLIRIGRWHQLRWVRELSFLMTVAGGLAVGALGSWLGRLLFPHL